MTINYCMLFPFLNSRSLTLFNFFFYVWIVNQMRKKNINFVEQIKNSENFLQKLENIKKTSKDLKDKNKLTVHRNIWVKQFKYLSRLERQAENQLEIFFDTLDQYLQYEYEDRQIFKKDDYNSYKQMKDHLNNDCQVFQHKMFKQMENLPLLIQKCQTLKEQEISIEDIKNFIYDIGTLLQKTNEQLNKLQDQHRNEGDDIIVADQYDQGYDDIVFYLKPIADEVKGFDFKKQRLKKIEDGQSHLLDYLLNFQDNLSGDEISQVIQQFNYANNLLHQTLQLEIQKINLDYQQVLNFTHEVIRNSNRYQKFLHLYQIYVGRGKSLIQYFERLAIQFPKVSKPNLESINDYIVGKIYKQRKIKAAKRNFLREKEDLFYKVEKQVNLRIENKIKDAQKEAEKLMRRQEKLKLQKQLQLLRAQYNKRQEQKQKEQKIIEEQKKAEEKKKESLRRLYLQDLSKRAEEVKEVKTQLTKKAQIQQLSRKEKEDLQKKKKIMQNQPKVQQRQSIQRKKIQKKVEIKQYKDKFKQVNQQRINKAIENYPFRPKAQFSQQRLIALTQAQVIRKQTQYDKADKIQLSKKTGYSINQLMGDMRYRLNAALNDAGLGQTQYAREVLLQMSRKPA